MCAMAHDKTNLVDRQPQIARGHIGNPMNALMTTQANSGIDFCLQIMGIGRGTKQVDRHILRPGFIAEPAFNARQHVAGDTGHLSMRGFHPTLIQGRDGMATGTACPVIRPRDGHSATRDGRFRFPAHVPHETAILGTAS